MLFDGEATKEVFYLFKQQPFAVEVDIPQSKRRVCCSDFSLKALASVDDTDETKNDITTFDWFFDDVITSATMYLYKFQNGDYELIEEINDNTYGDVYLFGSNIDSFGRNYVGVKVEWRNVLTIHGAGSYKIGVEYTDTFSNSYTIKSAEVCLKSYNANIANGTVRIDYYLNGIVGDNNNDELKRDFMQLNRRSSLRLDGFFAFKNSEYERDFVEYENGQRVFVESEQTPEYILKLKPIAYFVHDILRTDVFQADNILVTDYNSNSSFNFVNKKVIPNSNYEPKWNYLKSKTAAVDLVFKNEFNNYRKLRS